MRALSRNETARSVQAPGNGLLLSALRETPRRRMPVKIELFRPLAHCQLPSLRILPKCNHNSITARRHIQKKSETALRSSDPPASRMITSTPDIFAPVTVENSGVTLYSVAIASMAALSTIPIPPLTQRTSPGVCASPATSLAPSLNQTDLTHPQKYGIILLFRTCYDSSSQYRASA